MAFKIITDSASDVPQSVIKEYDLYVMPTPVTIDDIDYFDGDTIFPDDFYKIQAEGKDIKTYHISQYMFEEHFRPFAKNGDEVLYICFSTGIAGTFQAANLAKETILEEYPDFKITIIDSKCASIGFGLVTEKLLRMQKNGAPKELIIEAAQFFCDHMCHNAAVKTLEYLHKGGRISKTSAIAGTMLDIKPVLEVNDDGALVVIDKVRGWNKAIKKVVEIVKKEGKDLDKQIIGVAQGVEPEGYEKLKKALKEECNVKGFLDAQVGCAIGAHTGPGILVVVFQDAVDERFEKYL